MPAFIPIATASGRVAALQLLSFVSFSCTPPSPSPRHRWPPLVPRDVWARLRWWETSSALRHFGSLLPEAAQPPDLTGFRRPASCDAATGPTPADLRRCVCALPRARTPIAFQPHCLPVSSPPRYFGLPCPAQPPTSQSHPRPPPCRSLTAGSHRHRPHPRARRDPAQYACESLHSGDVCIVGKD